MAITRSVAAQDASVDAVVDLLDGGTTNPTGELIFRTAGDAAVATLAFANPAFGASATGAATANAIADDPSAVGGTTTKFTAEDRDNGAGGVFAGTVTATSGGGDIELSTNIIAASDVVRITSLVYKSPEAP